MSYLVDIAMLSSKSSDIGFCRVCQYALWYHVRFKDMVGDDILDSVDSQVHAV